MARKRAPQERDAKRFKEFKKQKWGGKDGWKEDRDAVPSRFPCKHLIKRIC
jgi:hypothetical protein